MLLKDFISGVTHLHVNEDETPHMSISEVIRDCLEDVRDILRSEPQSTLAVYYHEGVLIFRVDDETGDLSSLVTHMRNGGVEGFIHIDPNTGRTVDDSDVERFHFLEA